MNSYIAIEGPIAVGKTTLVQKLQERLGAETILDVSDNPFLAEFYKERPAAAFKTQMYFLAARFEQQVELERARRSKALLVSDYLFARDKISAYLNLDDQEILIWLCTSRLRWVCWWKGSGGAMSNTKRRSPKATLKS
jgi:deoxyguanosine kinase